MKDEIKSKLDSLFDRHDEKKIHEEKRQEEIKSAESIFLDEFNKVREDIIKPALFEVGDLLKQRGHDYAIKQNDEEIDHEGRTNSARITIDIYPECRKGSSVDSHPHLSYFADKSKRAVSVHGSNMVFGGGGTAGKRGEYELNNITSDTVQTDTAKLLFEVFKK